MSKQAYINSFVSFLRKYNGPWNREFTTLYFSDVMHDIPCYHMVNAASGEKYWSKLKEHGMIVEKNKEGSYCLTFDDNYKWFVGSYEHFGEKCQLVVSCDWIIKREGSYMGFGNSITVYYKGKAIFQQHYGQWSIWGKYNESEIENMQ